MSEADGLPEVVRLPLGLVGLPTARRFRVRRTEPDVYDLESLDEPGLGFVAVTPTPYFPAYSPIIDPETADHLRVRSPEELLVLLLVNLGSDREPPGANLLAPLLVNRRTGEGMQVVLIDQELPLRATFPAR